MIILESSYRNLCSWLLSR